MLWRHETSSYVDLNGNAPSSRAYAAFGSIQVGYVGRRACKWSGTADSVVDLSPPGAGQSEAHGVAANMIVGYGYFENTGGEECFSSDHAGYWTDGADSWHELHPAEYHTSQAYATDGVQQVGLVAPFYEPCILFYDPPQACVWNGTPESCVNLNPNGMWYSEARGVSNGVQVGWVSGPAINYEEHASLWRGSAESWVDLNPAGAVSSRAVDVLGNTQVGYWDGENTRHAVMWQGSASNTIDLQQFLPDCYDTSQARAIGTGPNGEVWILGEAGSSVTGLHDLVVWYAVPEPSSLVVLGMGLLPIAVSLRRRMRG